ncbi:MAG: hypothetical protein JW893_01500 [Candidatus Omnitrophica bacterium]|nr:hypothetical protein [Candidatus Omnitrophota bacterium]
MIHRRLGAFGVVFILSCTLILNVAHAFSVSWPSLFKERKSQVCSRMHDDYMVLFYFTGNSEKRKNLKGKKEKWLEMNYKLVNRKENPADLFGKSRTGEVRFLDEEGYSVLSVAVHFEDLLLKREYYGELWVEKSRAKKMVSADFIAVAPSRLDKVKRQHKRLTEDGVIRNSDEIIQMIAAKDAEYIERMKEEEREKAERMRPVIEDVEEEPEPEIIPPTEDEMRVEMDKTLENDPARVTNEEVEGLLEEASKQEPTKIEFPGTLQ